MHLSVSLRELTARHHPAALRTQYGLSQTRTLPDFLPGLQPPSPLLKRPQPRGGGRTRKAALPKSTHALSVSRNPTLSATHHPPRARATSAQSFPRRPTPVSSSDGCHSRSAQQGTRKKGPKSKTPRRLWEVQYTVAKFLKQSCRPGPAERLLGVTSGLRVRSTDLGPLEA